MDLKDESRKLEAPAAGGAKPEGGMRSAYREWDVRAFRIPARRPGAASAEVEGSFAPARVFLKRLRRGGRHARR